MYSSHIFCNNATQLTEFIHLLHSTNTPYFYFLVLFVTLVLLLLIVNHDSCLHDFFMLFNIPSMHFAFRKNIILAFCMFDSSLLSISNSISIVYFQEYKCSSSDPIIDFSIFYSIYFNMSLSTLKYFKISSIKFVL